MAHLGFWHLRTSGVSSIFSNLARVKIFFRDGLCRLLLMISLLSALLLVYRPGCASMYSWREGLYHCDASDGTRQPTMEDVSTLRQDSWIFAAKFFLYINNVHLLITVRLFPLNSFCVIETVHMQHSNSLAFNHGIL